MGVASTASVLKSYSAPPFLVCLAIFVQLVILPSSFPPSHYDVLDFKMYRPIEKVTDAYEKLSAKT